MQIDIDIQFIETCSECNGTTIDWHNQSCPGCLKRNGKCTERQLTDLGVRLVEFLMFMGVNPSHETAAIY